MSIRKRSWTTAKGETKEAWIVDYSDATGVRRLKTFTRKKDADAWAVTARHEVKQGVHTPASTSVTVTDATERWIAECEANGLEFGTIKQRREHLRLHIAPFIGREKLSALTAPRIKQFIGELRDNGRSLAMRRKVLTNLKTILSFAQEHGLVAQNVARGIKVQGEERQAGNGPLRDGVDFPNRVELRKIMDGAQGRWRPFVITAVFTGMRASELRGLTWSSVDLENALIHVRQRADAWGKIGAPKSEAGSRDIPLAPMVVNALKEWQKACPAGEAGLVFPNGAGNVENHQNILNRFWHPLQVKHGMVTATGEPKYGLHALRHAAASLFIAHLGWQPKRVQEVMGHASMAMTFDLYGHLFRDPESDKEAMKRLEAAVVAA
jgi:integrase